MDIAEREGAAARDIGARITAHASGKDQLAKLGNAIKLEPDTTYVHCGRYGADDWKLMAQSGGSYSVSPGTEMLIHAAAAGRARRRHPADAVDRRGDQRADHDVRADAALPRRTARRADRTQGAGREGPAEADLGARRDRIRDHRRRQGLRPRGQDRLPLTPGRQADVIVLRKDAINVLPVNDPLAAIALGMDGSNVDTVLVAGQVKKRKLAGIISIGDLAKHGLDDLELEASVLRDVYIASH
jgi:cytosine/adenosine deaminase-related metal-dependent hydrolase